MTIGGTLTIRTMLHGMTTKQIYGNIDHCWTLIPNHNRQIHINGSIHACWKNHVTMLAYLTHWMLRQDHFFPPVIN
jgi:hypothetical protein